MESKFSKENKDIAPGNYEPIQGDTFDHLLSTLPEYDLSPYQSPNDAELEKAGARITGTGLQAKLGAFGLSLVSLHQQCRIQTHVTAAFLNIVSFQRNDVFPHLEGIGKRSEGIVFRPACFVFFDLHLAVFPSHDAF